MTFPNGSTANLEALITRPDRPGRFPLVMINHGYPRDLMQIPRMTPEAYSTVSIVFAQHGYAAVVVNRRGFGLSSGAVDVAMNPCNGRNYEREGRVSAEDVTAALAVLRLEPWTDPSRIVLLGHSAGGLAVLAAATAPLPGVIGVLDFAGGRGSSRPDFVCNADGLVQTMHDFGMHTRVPSLWVFAENDHFFGPEIADKMFAAYISGGAPAEFFAAPAYGSEGHMLIQAADAASWWTRVGAFLDKQHLPSQSMIDLPPVTLLPPPNAPERIRAAFANYAASRGYEKAFAVSTDGHYGTANGRRSREDATAGALDNCRKYGTGCTVYAVGDTLAKP
ncbi:MAG TPA: CocE/NonD family hydrolase [Acetobacteraceae bacterium]